MLYLALPTGSSHGWGVCGKYLTRELAALDEVTLITDPFDLKAIGDELDYALLRSKVAKNGAAARIREAPLLQGIANATMAPYRPELSGRPTVGYTFFEDNLAIARYVEQARRRYDVIAAGSRWCAQFLRYYGFAPVTTIVQGVDSTIFHPHRNEKEYWQDRFVVFSGGKFEFRKGQDLVMRAFKVLAERHRDVLLVAAWHNYWSFSVQTMCASPYIRFQPGGAEFNAMVLRLLEDNGLDVDRVLLLAPRANALMARIYRNTDVGLFPNRCEGGTNLVLMEYMACGKPAIASFSSGHKDVLTAENSIRIEAMQPLTIRDSEGDVALWDDPDLEETIEHLEWAYQHREELAAIGRRAAADMASFTWRRAAEQFYSLLKGMPPARFPLPSDKKD